MMYAIYCFLLLAACSSNAENMQKTNPAGSAAKLKDLSVSSNKNENS